MLLVLSNGSYLCVREFKNSLHELESAYPTAKIFLGRAFNSPGINWSNDSITDSYNMY